MKIGQAVWFVTTVGGNELAPVNQIFVGQVVGIMDNGHTVGDVPEDATEDGVNVKLVKLANFNNLWVNRKQGVHKLDPYSELGRAAYKILGIEMGASAKDKALGVATTFGSVASFGSSTEEEEDEDEEKENNFLEEEGDEEEQEDEEQY